MNHNHQSGMTLIGVLMLISILSISYAISEKKVSNAKVSNKIIRTNIVENSLREKISTICQSSSVILSSAFSSVVSDNIEVKNCLTDVNTCLSTQNAKIVLLGLEQSGKLTGTIDCPAFFGKVGEINSIGPDFNRCTATEEDQFSVSSSMEITCPSSQASCPIASSLDITCTVNKLKDGKIATTWSKTFPIGAFVCPGTEYGVVGLDSSGNFICERKVAIVGSDGPDGPPGDSLPGIKGPDGTFFHTLRVLGCFLNGTKIRTQYGNISIEDVNPFKHLIWDPIVEQYFPIDQIVKGLEYDEIIQITTESGFKVSVTQKHPMLTEEGMVMAKDITENDHLLTANGLESIDSIENLEFSLPPTVYNIQMSDLPLEKTTNTLVANEIMTGDLLIQHMLDQYNFDSFSENDFQLNRGF